jgi:hypothetical protein
VGVRAKVVNGIERILGPERADAAREVDIRVRRRIIAALDVEARGKARGASARGAGRRGSLSREQLIEALGHATPEGLGAGSILPAGLHWASPDPYADYAKSASTRHSLLSGLHKRLKPRTYIEIGVNQGASLTLSRTRSIGVDPAYRITKPLHCDLVTYLETSDAFFARPDAFEHFNGVPVDLAFIDGMHLAEYALRDFMNMEKHVAPGGVVVLDDVLPRNDLEAYRVRRTQAWAGDVFKVHAVLQQYRPDLTLLPLNTQPTGSYMILGTDPSSTVLDEAYESLVPYLTSKDPQKVDIEWLERRDSVDPAVLLRSDVWDEVVRLRNAGAERDAFTDLWKALTT